MKAGRLTRLGAAVREALFPLRAAAVYTDGAIRPADGLSGLAAVVRDSQGKVRWLWSEPAGALTCNEAEYAAAILALERLHALGVREVDVYSDSQVMVHQMTGLAQARAPALRLAHNRLQKLAARFHRVRFHHIPREKNELADALASEAAGEA